MLSKACFRILQLIRLMRLRLSGVAIGSRCVIGKGVRIDRSVVVDDNVTLADGCVLTGRVSLSKGVSIRKLAELSGNIEVAEGAVIGAYSFVSTMPEGKIRIGRYALVNCYTVIGAGEHVDIGDDCIFAAHVHITDSSHRFRLRTDSPRHDSAFSSPVHIDKGTWLGGGVKVLMGVHMGEGCVVGSGAVVTRSLPAWSISVGVPARVLGFRDEVEEAHIGRE